MKKILLLGLMLLGLGGVISVSAKKTFWSPQTGFSSWDDATSTMTWTSSNGYCFIYTGFTPYRYWDLPENDYSEYETIHFNVSDVTTGGKVQLKIGSTGHNALMIDLKEGENYIIFDDYSANIDITKITEMTLWGAGVDNGSAVITDVYMDTEAPFVVITDISFGTEITKLSDITGGKKFVISDNGTNAKYFYTNNENENANVKDVPYDSYFYFTLEPYTGDDVAGAYWIKITNAAGDSYPRGTNGGTYLNAILTFSEAAISAQKEGWSNVGNEQKDALWYVTYDAEKGFSFQNVYRSENNLSSWLAIGNKFKSDQQYLKLYESINFTSTTMYPANEEIFALSKATGYDAGTGEMTNGTWTFDTPVDISKWDYLMITTVNTPSDPNVSHEITIKDVNDVSVQGEGYVGSAAETGGNMWLDRWNNQNAIRISIDYLKNEKSMDITKIKSLKINGTTKIANVYLTDYNNTKINGGYSEGDVKREYSETGKFGTICLPYKASYAGAEIYSIASASASGVTLEKVIGLLEAGKPYIYVSTDENGQNNEGSVRNVNFFRADFDTYDVAEPIANNGLIGTFGNPSETEYVPVGDDNYVIGRAAGDTEDKLYQVDQTVTLGANRAYINMAAITNKPANSRTLFVSFDGAEENDPTAIESTEAVEVLTEGVFYDMSGREVKNPTTGIYIVKYGNVTKKVMIK